MKIIILVFFLLFNNNLSAGVINWTKKKVVNIAKDKTKDYGKKKWKNYREYVKSTENSENKGKITKIEEKVENIKVDMVYYQMKIIYQEVMVYLNIFY